MVKRKRNSVVCVGVARLRIKLGLTQTELARRAGYSVRLVSKAENGAPISRTTAEDLAEALEVGVDVIVFDPEKTAETFIGFMHVTPEFLLKKIPEMFHPDCVVNMAGPEEIPFSGVYHGIEGATKCFSIFYDVLEIPDRDNMASYEFYGYEDFALAHGDSWLHPKGMPLAQPMKVSLKFKFKDSKILRFDDLFDTDKGMKVIFPEDFPES